MVKAHHCLLSFLLLLVAAAPLSAASLPKLLEKGQGQLEKEKYARALETFREARALDAESPEVARGFSQALYGRAMDLFRDDHSLGEARGLLEELLELSNDPTQRLKAYNLLGTVIYNNSELPEAERLKAAEAAFSQAQQLSGGKDASSNLGLAAVLRDLGAPERALAHARAVPVDTLDRETRIRIRGLLCAIKRQVGEVPEEEPSEPQAIQGPVQKPKKLYAPQPQYTKRLRQDKITGVVTFLSHIDRDGCVGNLRLLNDDAPRELVPLVAQTVGNWLFDPATRNGEPVMVHYNISVNMHLQ